MSKKSLNKKEIFNFVRYGIYATTLFGLLMTAFFIMLTNDKFIMTVLKMANTVLSDFYIITLNRMINGNEFVLKGAIYFMKAFDSLMMVYSFFAISSALTALFVIMLWMKNKSKERRIKKT